MEPTVDDLSKLAQSFRELSESLEKFRFKNRNKLSKKEWKNIGITEDKLLDYATYLTTQGVNNILNNIKESMAGLQQSIGEAKEAIANVKAIKSTIIISTSIIGLGAAIASRDPAAIISAIGNVAETLNGA